ncbi:MAG: hypothetical protein IJP48_00735 [Synergistaceae bacterium]|nr:hypothetical protein [Synergistaceae bacterium]
MFIKKFFACLIFIFMLASGSFAAESEFWTSHVTDTSLVDGTGDFSSAQFKEVDITINAEGDSGEGSITFPGGGFTIVDEDNNFIETVAKGTSKKLILKWDGDEYKLAMTDGTIIKLVGDADENIAGQKVTWSFAADSNLTGGTITMPAFESTASQMSESGAVPNIELIMNGDNVTGLKYWIARASDPDTHITPSYKTDFRLCYRTDSDNIKSEWQTGRTEGEYTFASPIALSSVKRFYVRVRTYEDNNTARIHTWNFYIEDEPLASLWSSHISAAELVNGKSDFTNAAFYELQMNIGTELEVEAGSLTITNGGYSLVYDSQHEFLEEVAEGTSKTFDLKKDSETEFVPASDSGTDGRRLTFTGDADSSFAAQPLFWTLGDNIHGAARFPDFKTTSEQLLEAVPFIELITDSDGKITGVNYRVVKASDPDTEITTLAYQTDFRLGYKTKAKGSTTIKSDWQNDRTSGTYTFSESVSLSDVDYMLARLRTHDDSGNTCIYTWKFYPASNSTRSFGGSSGGCNSGLGVMGIALAVFAALKFKTFKK